MKLIESPKTQVFTLVIKRRVESYGARENYRYEILKILERTVEEENRNLLLNKGTRAETIPELEILNEDVSCSHGATIGPIDPLMTFYLRSRGVPEHLAVRMIVSGFVAATLKMVPDDLRERVDEFVAERLEGI